jgi:putative transposase
MLGLQKDDGLLEKSGSSLEPQANSKNLSWFGAEFAQKTKETTALALAMPVQSDLTWSLDFMSDSLSNDRAIRTLNIIDDYNREALWIEVDTSLPAEHVVRVLENLLLWRSVPKYIRMDNGPELISQRLGNWAKQKQIELLHIQPGKPAQNAYIERFNHTFREDVLDAYLFSSLDEVREIAEHWLEEYNTIRPHEALQGLSPRQYAQQHA